MKINDGMILTKLDDEFVAVSTGEVKSFHGIVKMNKTGADIYLDLLEAEQFDYRVLDHINFVIMTAAISSPDKCASDFDFCWGVNVTGTSHFIREAIKRGCRVLFFSSDAVFGDIPGKIYDEESDTRAVTAYGKMKKDPDLPGLYL